MTNVFRKARGFMLGALLGALLTALVFAPAPDFGGFTQHAQSAPMGPYGWIPWVTGNTATDTATLSAFQNLGILIGTPTAAAAYTTTTATNLCALFPFMQSGANSNYGWDWYVKNTSAGANTITVQAGSGVTVSGTATAAQNAVRHFKVVLTECRPGATAAATIFSLETTAF